MRSCVWPMVTLRDSKKRDKLARIRAAAAALFREHGYAGTTTRAIAEHAKIAHGTLFLYVTDKDDALTLVFHDEVGTMLAARRASLPARAGLAKRLEHLCRGFYELYVRHPELSLRFVRSIPTIEPRRASAHASLNAAIIEAFDAELLRAAQRGGLRPRVDRVVARGNLFAVFRVCVFEWLAQPSCDVERGMDHLRVAFGQLLDGIAR